MRISALFLQPTDVSQKQIHIAQVAAGFQSRIKIFKCSAKICANQAISATYLVVACVYGYHRYYVRGAPVVHSSIYTQYLGTTAQTQNFKFFGLIKKSKNWNIEWK